MAFMCDILRFFSQVFGSGASSLITAYVLRHHSQIIKELGMFPDNVVDMIADVFYVDDGNGNADDVDEAKILKKDLISVMAIRGFSQSNFPEILSEDEKGDKEDVTKVLGVSWQPEKDAFNFIFANTNHVKTPAEHRSEYKRKRAKTPHSFIGDVLAESSSLSPL